MTKHLKYFIWIPTLVLLGCFVYLLAGGEASAHRVQEQVVRFHVVGQSDSPRDQQLKLKVRDGIFQLVEQLFAPCADREEALEVARENQGRLAEAAQKILQENGCDAPVTVEIGERFFPTKDYGTLSFPAGRYQAVSVRIGPAAGQNFWCVLYPALCLSPSVAAHQSEQEMTAVVGERETAFLLQREPVQKIRFALVEWFETLVEKICKT